MGLSTATMPLPSIFIGKALTTSRIANYGTKHALLSTEISKPDTKSVWYSKEQITELMAEIDHAEGDGVRLFFGSYEDNHAEFAHQTCLLLVVTRAHTEGGHENVALEDEPDYEARSISFDEKKRDFNHGSPCPPSCDGFEGFGYP